MQLTIEFGGGLELLCQSVKVHHVDMMLKDGEKTLKMKDLLSWVRTNLIKERPEMFLKGDTVRPGVLVLINDCDWELCGQLDATLEEKDMGRETMGGKVARIGKTQMGQLEKAPPMVISIAKVSYIGRKLDTIYEDPDSHDLMVGSRGSIAESLLDSRWAENTSRVVSSREENVQCN